MLNIEGVINPLSFGYISFGLLKEFYTRKVPFNFCPISNNLDWQSFNSVDSEFQNFLNGSADSFNETFSVTNPAFRIWHINGSHTKLSKDSNSILTFHELDSLTKSEVNILNSFDKIFVTSRFSKSVFEDNGVKSPITYIPMGIDSDIFFDLKKPRPFKDTIVFSIFGKFEKRKRTIETIQAWVKKYGNDIKYKLHCYVTNPFYNNDQMNRAYAQVFNNQPKPFNVDIFPYLPTNSHLNEAYNATDIVLDMSGGESISLGSLNCIAMGKYGVVHNNSGIKDWANKDNAVLVSPSGKEPVYDGVFFHPNSKFNIGNIYTFNTDDFLSACDIAIQKFIANNININGLQLRESYSFKTGATSILKELNLN